MTEDKLEEVLENLMPTIITSIYTLLITILFLFFIIFQDYVERNNLLEIQQIFQQVRRELREVAKWKGG